MNIKVTSGALVVVVVIAAAGLFLAALQAQTPPSRSVWDSVYTEQQADRGRTLYDERCAVCHGQSLEGVEAAPALAGGQFLGTWNGQSVGDLFERTRTTMPQDDPGGLSRAANADITAFLLRANQFPSGKIELPRQNVVLNQILIEAKKPDQK